MHEATNNPRPAAEARRSTDEQQPRVEWTEDGIAIRFSRPAGLTDKQWHEYSDRMIAWADDHLAVLVEEIRRRRPR